MSRYIPVDDIIFTNVNGNEMKIKDIREIPNVSIKFVISMAAGDELDEIASRQEVFRDNGEVLSYRLFDANVLEIVENDFTLNFPKIKIPVNQ